MSSGNRREEKGFILVIAMITLIIMAIFLPSLVQMNRNDTKWAIKQKQSTTAFHMAEAGLDRGIWKLQESDLIWNWASTGAVIPGYNFDVIYASTGSSGEMEGEYSVKFSSRSDGNGIIIQSAGRDKTTNEVRALEAVYTKSAINAGLTSRGAFRYKSGLNIHWGPVVNFTSITEAPSQKYPRKITKGSIKEQAGWYDENANSPNGHDFYSDWPDPATYDYNTYQSRLGNPPTIDLDAYKAIAKATQMPRLKGKNSHGAAAGNNPVLSGYYDGTEDLDLGKADLVVPINNATPLIFYCSTCVLYLDGTGDLDIKDVASQVRLRAIIVKGDFDMNANNTPAYSARIPVGARTEYLHPTAMTDEWIAKFAGTGEGNVYNIPDEVQIHAYVYVGGDVTNSGGGDPAMVGGIDIVGDMTGNNMIVYYDSTISTGILATNVKPTIQYWREINAATLNLP
ncbi:MAG: hypothetical protein A2901_08305 [Elusimicrobia bacterium RIFCSPLOWO2_01_FULL_54_10]|nr:MAG: hypothetical protein A2901_08305 [Elusimicrobia bacterium RIFCSPLOWO2_01_FULL_54_10]